MSIPFGNENTLNEEGLHKLQEIKDRIASSEIDESEIDKWTAVVGTMLDGHEHVGLWNDPITAIREASVAFGSEHWVIVPIFKIPKEEPEDP